MHSIMTKVGIEAATIGEVIRNAEHMLHAGSDLSAPQQRCLTTIIKGGADFDIFQGVPLKDTSKTYKHAREVLASNGYSILTVEEESIDDLWGKLNQKLSPKNIANFLLGWCNKPPAMEVAINPATIAPKDSGNLTFAEQVAWLKIKEDELRTRTGLPDISLPIHDASTLAQFDIGFKRANRGENLYKGGGGYDQCYVRGGDQIGNDLTCSYVTMVGRDCNSELKALLSGTEETAPWLRVAYAIVLPPRK